MQGCKANCGGEAKLSRAHAKQIADVLCEIAAQEKAVCYTMPTRLSKVRETLTRELIQLAEATKSAGKGKSNRSR